MAIAVALAAGVALVGACSRQNQITAPGPSVTLTGCLEPGDARDTYLLTALGAPTGAVGTRGVGQIDRPPGSAAGSRTSDLGAFDTRLYRLVAEKNVDLARYQGSVVKVTGYLEQANNTKVTGLSGSGQAPATDQQTPPNSQNQPGSGANPTTGEGPQSSVHGPARNRPLDTIRVDRVQGVLADCGNTK